MVCGTVLNPCLEHAAWLGASHDVTYCRSGGGDSRTGQGAFIWAMDGSEATFGVTHDGPPVTPAGTRSPRGDSGCSCLFQLPTLPRALLRKAGGQGW